jgi:F-type H+-transporting ATPase subunit gamma
MGAVLANIAAAVGGGGDAPALMTGTGKDDVASFAGRARPNAVFAAASIRRSPVWPATCPRRLQQAGKTVKIITVGKKGA